MASQSELQNADFKILVAEDSQLYSLLIQRALSNQPCTLLCARNGREAFDLFAEHQPAVVITDWMMPEMSGPDLCRAIRQKFPQDYAHIILLTSNREKEDVITGLAAGADDYLTKPFHDGELVARVSVGRRIVELQRELQRRNHMLEEMALTDTLTGLPNRRAIDSWAERQLSAAIRHGFGFWVAIADLDFFKRVNDTCGHLGGDEVLRGFAEILRHNTRSSNICGRIGGEEFLLTLTYVGENDVRLVLERIRIALEKHEFLLAGKALNVTASFGATGFEKPTARPDFNQLVAAADSALYAAKRNGRNRIELFSRVAAASATSVQH
jgi:diguanylate cyclase (GGDEF)-like protein